MKKPKLSVIDHFKTKEVFSLEWNDELSCYQTIPRPKEEDMQMYYDSDAYISHQEKSTSLSGLVYNWVRKYMLKTKIKWILKEVKKGASLLDVGCGVGEFVKAAQQHQFDAQGMEPNKKARQIAKGHGLEVYKSLTEIQQSKFDVISLWHVLEHVHHPKEFLQEIKSKLTKQGCIFIALPNYKSYDAKYYKAFWAAYDVPRHLFHFNKEAVSKLAEENDLVVQKIYPLPFDSYYVSMLSEKYKTGSSGLNWIWQGCKSNIQAKRTGEWSSLVFVLHQKH